ncbi:MAG: hypothetical protein ACREPL_13550 [Rhodanobacteraceae bacterium]
MEQGRGGAPSASVLDRIAHALMLTDVERKHMFLLALGRPPATHYRRSESVTHDCSACLTRWKVAPPS